MVERADEIERLRRRAEALREVANGLDRSEVHGLRSLSGPGTWVGPTATWFDEVAAGAAKAADACRDELRAASRRLDERADELLAERAALASVTGAPGS